LTARCDEALANFAFNFNLCRYIMTPGILALLSAGANPNTESIKLKTTALMMAAAAGIDVNVAVGPDQIFLWNFL